MQPINKSDVEKAYSVSLGFEKGQFSDAFKEYRKLIRNDIRKTKWSFPDKKVACYLSQFWREGVKPVCYDAIDMAYYIRHYKGWLFYPDNMYGMAFYTYHKAMYDIFSREDKNTNAPYTFNKDFSAFIFEELFSSQSLMSTALSFSKHFSELFSDTKTGDREQAMVLFLPISLLSHDIRILYEPYYIGLIRKWSNSKLDSVLDEIIRTYASMLSLTDYYIPLLEISFILAIAEMYKYEGKGSIVAKDICKDLEQAYIAKNKRLYDRINDTFLAFQEARYPNGTMMIDDITKKRNNKAISTFEINFTYGFLHLSRYSYFDYIWSKGLKYMTVEAFLQVKIEDILKQFSSLAGKASGETICYKHYMNPDAIIFNSDILSIW